MNYSVVIPTRNRLSLLKQVLKALEEQQSAPEFEVVVVNDNSTDGTADWFAKQAFQIPCKLIAGDGVGPAAARNRGVEASQGDRIALLGDDTIPLPNWLEQHHSWAIDNTVATLGRTEWHPEMGESAFLHWLNEQGKQFGYSLIENEEDVSFAFFYSSNLTVPRQILLEEPFNEVFPHAAWEDIELGYRLLELGPMKLRYNREALVLHNHPTDLRRFARRQKLAGQAALHFATLHPQLTEWLGIPQRSTSRLRRLSRTLKYECLLCLSERVPGLGVGTWEACLNGFYQLGTQRVAGSKQLGAQR